MMSLSDDTQADVIEAFNSTSRYLDDLLNIDNPYVEGMEEDSDKDSGTESDDENNNLHTDADSTYYVTTYCCLERNTHETKNTHDSNTFSSGDRRATLKTHEVNDHNFDTLSCNSDFERHSLDFDGHSSEDELESISEENLMEKYIWNSESCQSTSSTDEEVRELLFNPQPVLIRSSPPKGALKIYTEKESTQHRLVRVLTPILNTVSPRKRHRQNMISNSPSDSEDETRAQRPCLNFEKMQQVRRLCPSYFKRCKMSKNVKLQTVC